MNNYTTTHLVQGVLGGMTIIVAGLTVLLVYEHRTLQRKVTRLIELKKEYKVFIRRYKVMLESGTLPLDAQEGDADDDDESDDDADAPDDQVAEYEDEPCATFIMVNRESDYLKEAAVSFAKEHNIEQSVKQLYTEDSHEPPLLASLVKPKRKKIMRSATAAARRRQYVPLPQELYDADFICPLERSRFWISSLYGPRKRKNGNWHFHNGIDMAALKGTPVYAVANGVVHDAVRSDKGYGNCIVLAHGTKFKTRYAHLHTLGVAKGQIVKKGQKIGTVGVSGLVLGRWGKESASHLHFEVMVYDKRVNPLWVVR